MQQLYIADLHLSEQNPRLTRGFLALLQHYQQHAEATQLYILGDWFNVWLADNDPSPWLLPIVAALRDFTAHGNQVFFLPGNRDFVLSQRFLDRFGGHLLQEPYIYQFDSLKIRLEHGDALCTDDMHYQRFKALIRQPIVLGFLKSLPFFLKVRLAQYARRKSRSSQQMRLPVDVNGDAVAAALAGNDLLIHGHTHRPAIHPICDRQRIVLGDWHIEAHNGAKIGYARILLIKNRDTIEWINWSF